MASKFCLVFLLIFCSGVQCGIMESSYDYLLTLGKSLAPNFLSILECMSNEQPWGCAREKAGKMLDGWGEQVEKERKLWEEEADAQIRSSGRSIEEMPSKIGRELSESMNSLTSILGRSLASVLERKKHGHGGGIDSITISAGGGDKKKMKKKPKPPKIHLIHPMMVPMRKAHKEEKGRNFGQGVQSWVIGERSLPEAVNSTPGVEELPEENSTPVVAVKSRGIGSDLWAMGQDALDTLAEHVVQNEELENGIKDRSSVEEQRGKKKKKKKAILKLLILGAVIKAKIGTLLQILTYKLQIKFFLVSLATLAVNLARLWIDIKNKNKKSEPEKEWRRNIMTDRQTNGQQIDRNSVPNPENIIYYEHAQHQHHYDHEEEESHGWGPWSRSILPDDETDAETSAPSPYRAQERQPLLYNRPYLTRV